MSPCIGDKLGTESIVNVLLRIERLTQIKLEYDVEIVVLLTVHRANDCAKPK
ncbi:hypothetical protein D3C84_992780 [compost metagenome]